MRQYVGVALVKKDKSVLAQLRDDKPGILGPNTWCVPGGAVEDGEDLEQAAKREFLEETGYQLEKLRVVAKDVYTTERGIQVGRTIFSDTYDEKQKINCFEGQRMEFLSREDLDKKEIYSGHREFLKKALEVFSSGHPELEL